MSIKAFLNIEDSNTPVNLVLGGGGAKGVGHVALLEFLIRHDIKINAISGASSGALVAALFASGMKPKEILNFFKTTPIIKYHWFSPTKGGIFDSSKYVYILKDFVKEIFEDLNLPIHITAVNIQEGRAVYFNKGKLILPLLASCAIPAVFSPVDIDGELYSDGGVMDNFPILPFVNESLPIIGSYVSLPSYRSKEELNSIIKVTDQANSLLLHAANRYKFKKVTKLFNFPLGHYGVFDSKKSDEIYQLSVDYLEHASREQKSES